MIRRPHIALMLLLTAGFTLMACSEQAPVEPTAQLGGPDIAYRSDDPTPIDEEFLDELEAGVFTVCKVVDGTPRTFTFETTAVGPGVDTAPIYEPIVELGHMECADVYAAPEVSGSDDVTITEIVPEGWQVDRVFIWSLDVVQGEPIITSHEEPAGTTTVTGAISANKLGCVVIFYNSEIPDEGGCVRSPGYWKTHPDEWPTDTITIGGTEYTKEEALEILWAPERGDKSKTLFRALVAAKLNALADADISCVSAEMEATDEWLADHPACSNVRGNSDAWKLGEPLYDTLNDYNNGRLCTPYCEDPEDDDKDDSDLTAVRTH